MRSSDRLLVMAALASSIVAIALHAVRAPEAIAASRTATDLGPADALVLNDPKPASASNPKEVRFRAEGGRLAWSDRATSKAWSIGAVNVDKAMKAILGGASYADRRNELDEEAKKEDEAFGKRFEALRDRYKDVDPKSPEFPQAQQELEQLRGEYVHWREGSLQIREKFFAEQIEKAYRDLVSATEIVAEREEIDIVMRFLPTAHPFEADTLGTAREQVIGRTFLAYPETLDMTDEVMKELGIS